LPACANAPAAAPLILPERDKVRAPNELAHQAASSCRVFYQETIPRKRTCMAASAAYLIALALTLLILVVLWESLS
jgi:hypothetical protein